MSTTQNEQYVSMQIENVAFVKPRTKKETEDLHRRNRIFRAFKNAYRQLYLVEPDKYTVREDGFMLIWLRGRVITTASERRIQQLTRIYRDRINSNV